MKNQLKKILIQTKREVFSEISGNNTSILKGEGYDFLELKEYEYGEDVKNIDWMISAKLQKPYVKVYHSQKELNINIVPILGGSVYFGTHKLKQETITEICSILGFSAVKQGDPFVSCITHNNIEICTKKSKKIHSVHTMSEKVFNYNVLGKRVDYHSITNGLYSHIRKKSIIFLIGDFFDIQELDLKLLSKKHEVFVIIVRDHFEEEPHALGNTNLIDPATQETFDGIISQSAIKKYKAVIKQNDHELFIHLQKCGIKFVKIYTNDQAISKLIGLMRR